MAAISAGFALLGIAGIYALPGAWGLIAAVVLAGLASFLFARRSGSNVREAALIGFSGLVVTVLVFYPAIIIWFRVTEGFWVGQD